MKNHKYTMNKKFLITYIQLFLLINLTIAISYLTSDNFLYKENVKDEKISFLKKYSELIKKPILSFVSSAEENYYGCCLETKTGEYCKESYSSECLSGFNRGTSCSSLNSCKKGCCYNDEKTIFNRNTFKYVCDKGVNRWIESPLCNLDIAKQGCCIVGSDVSFTTKGACEILTQNSPLRDGNQIEWIETSEQACIAIQDFATLGACVLSDKSCKMQTALECQKISGDYHSNLLCTAPQLETICQKTQRTICDEETGRIFYLDSCGNKANIYDSVNYDNNDYWTKVFNVMESCVLSSLNPLTCGNCNRFDNTYCSNAVNDGLTPSQGIYYCKPQDCTYIPSEYTNSEDSTPRTYKNGETWCIYESKIGEGKEVPGSTNYLAQCDQGEIKINPCGTFGIRNELCIQEESTDYLSGNTFSKATCQPNPADTCYSFNGGETEEEKEDNLEKCSNQPGCIAKDFLFSNNYSFSFCVPEYPKGLDFSRNTGTTNTCSFASSFISEIPIYFVQEDGKCKCYSNCEYLTKEFTEKMHDFCISFGDCGFNVNLLGEEGSSDCFKTTGLREILENEDEINNKYFNNLGDYEIKDKKITSLTPINFSDEKLGKLNSSYLNVIFKNHIPNEDTIEFDERFSSLMVNSLGYYNGTAYVSSDYGINYDNMLALSNFFSNYGWQSGSAGVGTALGLAAIKGLAFLAPTIGVASFALIGGWLGNIAMSSIVQNLGVSPELASVLITAATVGGAALLSGITILILNWGAANAWNHVGWILTIVGALITAWSFLSTLFAPSPATCPGEEIQEGVFMTKISFECNNWQPKTGGENCELCNDDPLGCNLAKCKSYGLSCNLKEGVCVPEAYTGYPQVKNLSFVTLNDEFGFEEVLESDINLQQLSLKDLVSLGTEQEYTFTEVAPGRSLSTTCFEPYENILFSFETTQASLCKFDSEPLPYNQMRFIIGENTRKFDHSTNFRFLSPDDLEETGFDGIADKNLYISCENTDGTSMPTPYKVEFCLNNVDNFLPPRVSNFNPKNNSFISFTKENQTIEFYTKYLADCKYSKYPYASFEDMSYSFNCANDLFEQTALGYKCSSRINTTEPITNIYIKCRNKYPLSVSEGERKTNEQDIIYTLKKPDEPISVEIITPEENEEIITIFEKTEKNLTIESFGGTDSHVCYYSTDSSDIRIPFYYEDYKRGKKIQLLDSLINGQYKFYVQCKDLITNELSEVKELNFNVTRKIEPPLIARVSQDANQIKFTTNEPSTCIYSTESCRFEKEDLKVYPISGDQINHRITAQTGLTYYIQCKDIYGQSPAGCSKIITAV